MRPIRYGDIRQILTSVADTTVTITSPTKRHFLITGSAAMYVLVLPDARTIGLGTPFVFENRSSEFVGVRNSSSVTWRRVPPRATCICALSDQTTAAGVWFSRVDESHDPAEGYHFSNDFHSIFASNNSYGELAMTGAVSAGGTNILYTTASAAFVGTCRTGVTTINSYAQLYTSRYSILGGGPTAVELRTWFNSLSTAGEEYICRAGFGDNITGGAHANGVYFIYDRAASGDFWVTRTIAAAGGSTSNISTIVPSINSVIPNALRVEVSSTGARVDFFVSKTLLFTHSIAANIPTTVTAFPQFGVTKTVVTADAARSVNVDFFDFIRSFTTPR